MLHACEHFVWSSCILCQRCFVATLFRSETKVQIKTMQKHKRHHESLWWIPLKCLFFTLAAHRHLVPLTSIFQLVVSVGWFSPNLYIKNLLFHSPFPSIENRLFRVPGRGIGLQHLSSEVLLGSAKPFPVTRCAARFRVQQLLFGGNGNSGNRPEGKESKKELVANDWWTLGGLWRFELVAFQYTTAVGGEWLIFVLLIEIIMQICLVYI